MASDSPSMSLPADNSRAQALRRRKTNRERVRVTRACDRCKRRKIKCNNAQPCQFCLRAKANCTFHSTYARGRAAALDVEDTLSGPPDASDLAPVVAEYGEPSQTDLQGHYIGPSSGVSFLLRVQKRLHQAISFSQPSSIFTFGDAPLHPPEFDPSFCMMLPRDGAQRLVDRYFDFAMPTYRFLHRPTVQEWFEEFYDTLGVMRDSQNAPAKLALLFMVFSHGRVYMPDNDRPGPSDLSARYYLAAEHQLAKEKGAIRLTSVQARLTQCYYLLTQSRINHCWSLSGTVRHLVLAIGLNRNRCPDAAGGTSQVEVECRRRTFWCAYTLDIYLSSALGRPRSFHDEDIDTELPACIEDEQLTTTHLDMSTSVSRGPSTMLAPLAHMKIARIISRILRDLYSIKPISERRRAAAVQTISNDLGDWRAELSWFLDTDSFSTSLLMPIFQRQRNVLNLTYWNSVILTHRPFVLGNFAHLSRQSHGFATTTYANPQSEDSVTQCLNAAMKTVSIIDEITQNHQLFRSLWITSYFAFNAAIMLYIYVIQKRSFPPDVYSHYLSAATRCQSHLSAIAEKGSLSERYCLVLGELRVEATYQTKRISPLSGVGDPTSLGTFPPTVMPISHHPDPAAAANYLDSVEEEVAMDFDDSIAGLPGSDSSGWGQFIHMVSSGLGNMDVLLDESLRG
ncbi:hypothetical protein FE257_007570 [Aspergillus nanangensis]|uniref:Zn(2)-C6 fungal-type domain-containing protein n=1 Tax=Aspergillus nanangensis TaxID=2582783 RepID=A0AAD4GU13_ASPNN|nr:hypothetical protein FE257_007570 [Aspergillus nanangensis]